MKKLIVLLTVMMTMTIATSSFAAVSCANLKAVSVVANEGVSSGGMVGFKNTGTTATCDGNLAVNEIKMFLLPSNTADKAMALVLTGISLTKVFVVWADNTDSSVATIVSVALEDQ